MKPIIKLVNLRKRFSFSDRWITNGVTLEIPEGKMTAIIGRSGEGKSVLLKQIIGLIRPTSGQVFVNNTDITKLDAKGHEEIYKKFGYVFQFAALLDSLTIFENIALPLLDAGVSAKEALPLVMEKVAVVNLKQDILYKYPNEISGGMKKRVGLARTLMRNPEVILYDEPTTGLDPITTRIVHELMYDMQQRFKMTSIVISHDQEIFKYADYVALLFKGKIEYFGDAKTIWESTNPFVYQFIRGLSEGPMEIDTSYTLQE